MQCHHNVVNFLSNPHKMQPMACLLERVIGCNLCFTSVNTVLYEISCYIGPCHDGTWLYVSFIYQSGNICTAILPFALLYYVPISWGMCSIIKWSCQISTHQSPTYPVGSSSTRGWHDNTAKNTGSVCCYNQILDTIFIITVMKIAKSKK